MEADLYSHILLQERLIDSNGRQTRFSSANDPLEVGGLVGRMRPNTRFGQIALLTDVVSGVDHKMVAYRQEAIEELSENTDAMNVIHEATKVVAEHEKELAMYLSEDQSLLEERGDDYYPRTLYRYGRMALASTLHIPENLQDKSFESVWLKQMLRSTHDFSMTNAAKLTKGKVYRTPVGLRSNDSLWRYALPLRLGYNGHPYTGRAIGTFIGVLVGLRLLSDNPSQAQELAQMSTQTASESDKFELIKMMGAVYAGFAPLMAGYGNLAADAVHKPMFISPVRKKILAEGSLEGHIIACTELDMLTAVARFKNRLEDNGHNVVFPTVIDEPSEPQRFTAKGIKNPILAHDKPDEAVVPNDIELSGLTMLTGPNSGGKSTIVKAMLLSQMMAEAGLPVVADSLETTRADFIHYMVPSAPVLGQETGRFGHELSELKDIFETATPRSFVGLDDCMDGTTHHERLVTLGNAMRGFDAIGSRLVFSTHATELVQDFADAGIGKQLQVEFDGEDPTHKVIDGVSHTSHADRVAKIVGMDKESIDESLTQRGYKV